MFMNRRILEKYTDLITSFLKDCELFKHNQCSNVSQFLRLLFAFFSLEQKKEAIVYVANMDRKEYFFANHHSDYGLGNGWVPCTEYIPYIVVPRPGIEDGIVDTIDKLRIVHFQDYTEIPCPENDTSLLRDIAKINNQITNKNEDIRYLRSEVKSLRNEVQSLEDRRAELNKVQRQNNVCCATMGCGGYPLPGKKFCNLCQKDVDNYNEENVNNNHVNSFIEYEKAMDSQNRAYCTTYGCPNEAMPGEKLCDVCIEHQDVENEMDKHSDELSRL